MPQFCCWGAMSGENGVIVGLDGYVVLGEVGCTAMVAELADAFTKNEYVFFTFSDVEEDFC